MQQQTLDQQPKSLKDLQEIWSKYVALDEEILAAISKESEYMNGVVILAWANSVHNDFFMPYLNYRAWQSEEQWALYTELDNDLPEVRELGRLKNVFLKALKKFPKKATTDKRLEHVKQEIAETKKRINEKRTAKRIAANKSK